MVDFAPSGGQNALRIYIEAQDRASGEVRKALQQIKKEEQAYSKDSEALDRQHWNSTHTARERDIRGAQEYYNRMRAKYDGDAQMQTKIAEAEQAKLAEIENKDVGKAPLQHLAALRATVAGAAMIGGAGMAAGLMSYRRADDAAQKATTADSAVSAIIRREQAKEELLSFIPVLGEVYKKIVQAVGGSEGWELLKGHIAQAKADFTDLSTTATKAVQQAAINAAAAFRALPADVQGIKDKIAADDRAKALDKAAEQRRSTERAYIEAKQQGLAGAPLAELKRQADQANKAEDQLKTASDSDTQSAAIRRRQAMDDEYQNFNRTSRDVQIAGIGAPMAGAIKAREDSDRRYADTLKQYEGLGDQRKALDETAGQERAAVETKWAGHIEALQKSGNSTALAEAQAARARNLADVDKSHAEEYARLNELEQRKTSIIAQQSTERSRIDRDASTARQRMIEDASMPITGKEIREVELRTITRRQTDERKGYEQLPQADKQALDQKHAAELTSFNRKNMVEEGDTARAMRAREANAENEITRSREVARRNELQAIDDQLELDRRRLSYSESLVRQAEREAGVRKQGVNERIDRERDSTALAIRRQAIDAAASNDQTISAAKARELRAIEADYEQRKASARKEDLQAVEDLHAAQVKALDTRYARIKEDSASNTTVSALRALGMGQVADLRESQSQFDKARRAAADNPEQVALINAQQRLSEARMKASAALPVTRETQSQTARFGGTLLRRTPGFDDPAMRANEEVRKAADALRKAVEGWSDIFTKAEKIGIVQLDSFR